MDRDARMFYAGRSQRDMTDVLGVSRALLKECGNDFKLTEISGIDIMVVVRG